MSLTENGGRIGERTRNGVKREGASFEFEDAGDEGMAPTANKLQKVQTCYAVYRKAGPGRLISGEERGQLQDFKHELHYLLTSIFDEKAPENVKSLSLIQLNKKAISPQFRSFLRTQTIQVERALGVLCDLTNLPVISLSASCLLYLMARDHKSIPLSENCFRLISELLKQDPQRAKTDDDYKKHVQTIWSILKDWLANCESGSSRKIQFDMTIDNLSSSFLALEALAYMSTKEHNSFFKSSLLITGCLTSIVAKLDKMVLELVHSTAEATSRLYVIERCFRILENAAAFDKKNQIFLIQHRNSLLIFSSAKFLNFASKFFEGYKSSSECISTSQQESNQIFKCVCLLCRVLMNISHENENASLKIGQVAGFLGNCLSLLASHFQTAPKDFFFDIYCMMCGLLVNLLEKCSANRRKFLSLKAIFVETNGQNINDASALEILTKLFIKHDTAAKTIDEELDNELADEQQFEDEAASLESGPTNETSMSEDEIIAAIQSAMNKASAHMEDSMIASYCSLVIAILVGSDEKSADQTKALLPNGDVSPMIDQLERFLEFMQITKKLKESTVKNIDRIIKSFALVANASS